MKYGTKGGGIEKLISKQQKPQQIKEKKSMKNKAPTVALINPPRHKIRSIHDILPSPCLALGYLGAVLLEENIEPVCIDAKFEGINFIQMEERIKAIKDIDIVGVTSMTKHIKDAHDTVRLVKKYHPKAIAITGGCHTTALPKETLREFNHFDIAVIGEGEQVMPEIVKSIREGRSLRNIKGIVYREDLELITTSPREMIADLDSLPFPAWHLFPKPEHTLLILTSRGCPFHCNFCMRVLGSKVRYRSLENIIAEMKYMIDNFGVKNFDFEDETFTLNKKRLKILLQMMIEEKIHEKVTWVIETRADQVDYNILSLMRQAGCVKMQYGVESGNDEILKNSGKNISKAQVETAVRAAKSLGFELALSFILGHPNETVESIKDTIDFAIKLNPDHIAFGLMVPYPGTEIREMALKGEGGYCSISTDWDDYGKTSGQPLELKNLSRRKLVSLQMRAYIQFYLFTFRPIDLIKLFFNNWRSAFSLISGWIKNIRRKTNNHFREEIT